MTKDETWLQERAAYLCAAFASRGIQLQRGRAVAIVASYRQSLVRSHNTTPAQARRFVTDFVLLRLAESTPAGEGDPVATGRGPLKPVDLRLVGTCLAALAEAVRVHVYEHDQCGALDAISVSAALAQQLTRDADPRVEVAVGPAVLAAAVATLQGAAHMLRWSADERDDLDCRDEEAIAGLTATAERLEGLLADAG